MNVYFDNAATTPMRKEVIQSIASVMEECFGNPSSTHAFGRTAKTHIETARKGIASFIKCSSPRNYFHFRRDGVGQYDFKLCRKRSRSYTLISSPIEHHAVLHALELYRKYIKSK